MLFKKSLFLGITAGFAAGLAATVYAQVYRYMLLVDFSAIAGASSLISACIFSCVLASVGFWASSYIFKSKGEIIFNLVFTLITFASILGPIAATLPLYVEFPELFPGFAIPMHFFPVVCWFTLKPMFFGASNGTA